MKKIVSLFTLLLCFVAVVVGASFTNPPPDECDDSASLCAYNFNNPSEAQPEQNGAMGTSYLLPFEVPATNLGRNEGEGFNEANTTATTRLYWPTGNSKAYRCGLESISYTTKSIAPTSYNSEWPTACSIARTCGGLLEVANYNPAPAPLSMPLG